MVVVMSEEFREKKDKNNTIKKNNTIWVLRICQLIIVIS